MSENRELTQRPWRRGTDGTRYGSRAKSQKTLKESVKKLMQYIAKYKIRYYCSDDLCSVAVLYSMW